MNSNTLLNKARINSSLSRDLSEKIFTFVFAEIRRLIKEKREVMIEELGSFNVVHRKMQARRDEGGQAEILLPPKDKIVFKPSDRLINRLKNDD